MKKSNVGKLQHITFQDSSFPMNIGWTCAEDIDEITVVGEIVGWIVKETSSLVTVCSAKTNRDFYALPFNIPKCSILTRKDLI